MNDTDALLIDAASGNADAVALLRRYVEVAHLWDDLIDRDSLVGEARINGAMIAALVEIPANPFFQRHQSTLLPLVLNAIRNWMVANEFEREGDARQQEAAYIMRSSFVDLIAHVAAITGGMEHSLDIAMRVRTATHHEGMGVYLQALAAEHAAKAKGE